MSGQGAPAGWGSVAALAVCAATLAVTNLNPALLLVVPFALLAVALPPRRPMIPVAGLLMLLLVVTGRPGGLLWHFERGWALLAGAWFVAMVVLLPARGFLERALAALAGAVLSAAALLAVRGSAFRGLDAAVAGHLSDAASKAGASWQRFARPQGGEASVTLEWITRFTELQALLFPALLALATLAGLAVAWWGYRRLAAADAEPLRPLREFRFPNDLVWVLIAGTALLLVPGSGVANRIGANLVTFMALLYALRGLAVLVVVGGAPGPLGLVVGVLAVVFLYPLVMVATVLVGLTDTWLDIRARRGAPGAG